ncbi:MAG: hypothetical protein ACI9NT_000692 [Bacteroidia bacterium]|jgi:hypothetical protein
MHELTRLAYLEAMGVDSYVSRHSLAGAVPTRRLALLRTPVDNAPANGSAVDSSSAHMPPQRERPAIDPSPVPQIVTTTDPVSTAPAAQAKRQAAPERFSLAAVVAGEWLWLEDLAGMPISREQVWLISAMAQALGLSAARHRGAEPGAGLSSKPDVAQFDWPIHTNDQFDLGEEAAQASVAGFVSRRMDQFKCRGLVLLGQNCEHRLLAQQVAVPMVKTSSTSQMLAEPSTKAFVWRDLAPLLQA